MDTKIAMPVKPNPKNREEYVVSSAFGHAPLIAIVSPDGSIEIIKVEIQGGRNIANLLKQHDIKVVLTSHLGRGAYNALLETGIKPYYVPSGISIDTALKMYQSGDAKPFSQADIDSCGHHH